MIFHVLSISDLWSCLNMAHEEEVIANNNEIYSRHLLLFNAEGH